MKIKIKSEEEIQEEARRKFLGMMLRKSLFERGEPLMGELIWVVKGRENEAEHEKILPDYCYNIFELLNRTLFKVCPARNELVAVTDKNLAASGKSMEDAKRCLRVDWEKVGVMVGIGVRSFRFFEVELEETLKQAGLLDLDAEEDKTLEKLFIDSDWLEKKTAEIQAQDVGKPVEEILENRLMALQENIKGSIPKWNELAYQWGPEAMTLLSKGIARGTSGCLDKKGALVGKSKLQLLETYFFLLITWPEIQEMISANPRKTRNNLWEWLEPFSYANWIEIKDLDQLNRLCDSIKLKLKGPGPPRKVK